MANAVHLWPRCEGDLRGVSPASPGPLKLELPAEKCCGGWGMPVSRPSPWIPIF